MEETLVLLKPDCLEGRKCGEVLKRFEEAGFDVFGVKMMGLSDEILREHYAHLADKPFFPEIQGFMQSSPVVALAMRGENAITRVRDMRTARFWNSFRIRGFPLCLRLPLPPFPLPLPLPFSPGEGCPAAPCELLRHNSH